MFNISVVIITFNSEKFITQCINSLFIQNYLNCEIIVVDNGSQDNTIQLVQAYKKIVLIKNERNLGACKARNQGIEVSSGEWILTLDCDVVLEKDFFSKISNFIKDLPFNVGMIQPKILRPDKKTIYSCGLYLSWLRRFYDIGKNREDKGQFDNFQHVFGGCSAATFYRRTMLENIKEKTGYFDERFFFLVEDVDLAWRAQRKGWKAKFIPSLICYHHGNSSRFDNKKRQYLCFRNRYYTIRKNEGINKYFYRIIPLLCYDMPRFLYLLVTNKNLYIDSMFFKALKYIDS